MSNNYFLKPNNFYIEEEYNFGKYFLNLNKTRSNLHILIPISNNFFSLSFIYGKSGLLNPIRNNFTFSIYYKIVYDEVSNNYTIYDYLGNDYLYEFDNSKSVYISKDNGTVLRFDSIYNEIYVYYPDQSHMLFKFDPSTDNEQIIIPNYMENKEKERITFSSYTLNSVNYIEISGTKNQKILIKKNNNATLSYSIEVVNTLINTIIRKYSFYEMSSSTYIFREDVLGSDHSTFVTHNQVQFSISNNLSITSSKDNTTLTFTYNTQNGYYTNVTNSYTNNSYIISYNYNINSRYTSVTSNSNGVSKACYYGYDNQDAPLYFIDYRGNIKNFTYENNKLLTSYPIINLNDGDNLLTNGDFNNDLENWDINGTVNINDSIPSNKKLPKSLSKFVSITSNSNISQTIDVNGDLYTSIYLYLECYSTLTSQFRVTLSFYRDDLLIKPYSKIYSSKNYVLPVNDCFECGGYYFNKIIISITGLNTVIAANIGNIKLIKTVDVVKNKYNDKYGLIYESKTLGKNIQEISYGVDENIKISSSRNNRKFSTYSTSDNYIETNTNGNKQRVFYNRDDELNIISKTIRKSFNNIYLYKEETYLHNMLINVEDEQKIDHEYLYDGYHFYINNYKISNNSSENYSVIYNLNDYFNISSQSINGNNVDYVYDVNGANQKLNDVSSSELKYTFTYSSNDLPSTVFFKDSNNTSSMVISYTYLSGNFKSDVILSKVYSGSNQIMFAYDSYYEYITTISNTEKTLYIFTYSNSLLTSETNFCGSSINRYYYEYENAYLVEEGDETYKINYIYDGRYQLAFTKDNNLINSSFSTTLDYSYDKEYISNLLESSGFGLVNNLSSNNSSFSGTKEGLIIKYPLINNPSINRTNDSGLNCFTPSVNGVAPVYRIYEKDVLELPSYQEINFLIKPNSLNQVQYLFTLIFNHEILSNRLSLYINEENKFVLSHFYGLQINSTPINSNLLINKWNLVRFRYNHETNEYRISINYSQFVNFDNIDPFVSPSSLLNIDLVLGSNISSDLTNYNSHFNGKIAIPMISHPNTYFDDDAYNLYDKYIETKTSNNSYFSNELSDNAFNKSYYLDNLLTNNFPLNGSFKSLDDKSFDEQKTIKGVNDFIFNEDVSAFMYELGVNKYLRKNNCLSFDKGIVTLLIKPLNKSILSRSNVILHFKNGDYGYYFLIDESNKLYFNTYHTIDSSRFLNITLQSGQTKRLTINYFRTGSKSLTFNVKYGEVSQTTTINNINFVTGSMDLVLGCYYKNYSASCLIGSLSYNNVNMDINSFISGLDKNIHTSIITDKFNRLSLEKISCNNNSLITKSYSYKAIPQEGDVQIVGVTRTTNVLQNETINVGSASFSYDYTFDYLGRVTSISSIGNTLSRYEYDSKGFISRKWSGDILSDIYSYDSKGNIINISRGPERYEMTYDSYNRISSYIDKSITGIINKNLSFSYNPSETYQLKTITDSISGNVINLSYIGNRLSSYIVSNGNQTVSNIQFIYNSKGERIYKIVNNSPIKYRYQNGCLVESISSNSTVRYLYDSSNNAIGFIYNSNKYFYIRDALKCIKKIIDETGNTVVTYNYSPFGKILSIQDSSGINLGNINQILYKGYVYDVETGLFMMGHRYYSPELCRFIQLDDIEYLDPESINGLNLYAYCNNDPINKYDPTGHSAILTMILIGTLFGAAVGFGFDVGKQLINNGWDFSKIDLGSAFNSAIVGGALGFSLAMGVGYLGPVIAGTATAGGLTAGGAFAISTAVSFAAGALGYATEEWMNGRTPSFGKAMMHGGLVALEGMVNFGVGGIVGSLGNVGTKGKFLTSKEWWGKFIFGLEFTQPFKIGIDFIRKNI